MEPLVVETKLFQIYDQRLWKLLTRELTKYLQLIEEMLMLIDETKLHNSRNSLLTRVFTNVTPDKAVSRWSFNIFYPH